jgi:hypothetical protein
MYVRTTGLNGKRWYRYKISQERFVVAQHGRYPPRRLALKLVDTKFESETFQNSIRSSTEGKRF